MTTLLHSQAKANQVASMMQQLLGDAVSMPAAGLDAAQAALISCLKAAADLVRELQECQLDIFNRWQVCPSASDIAVKLVQGKLSDFLQDSISRGLAAEFYYSEDAQSSI